MAVRLVKFAFTQGGKQIWLDWSKELERRREEVLQTLKNEGVTSEACFISASGEEVYYFMEAEDFEKARKAVSETPFPIDLEHTDARAKSLQFIEELTPLFHFKNK